MEFLPNEVIAEIFSDLDFKSLMSVSSLGHRFREIARIQSVWTNKSIIFEQERDVEEATEFFVDVKELECIYITVKKEEILASVDKFLSHFEAIWSLYISNWSLAAKKLR